MSAEGHPLYGGSDQRPNVGNKIFVAHRATGVHLIPEEWLNAWRPSGFREATPTEVLGWYDEREMDPPSEVLQAVHDVPLDDEERPRPVTLTPERIPPPLSLAQTVFHAPSKSL